MFVGRPCQMEGVFMDRIEPVPGEVYADRQGHKVKILCLSVHIKTKEKLVVYEMLMDGGEIYACPKKDFLDLFGSLGTLSGESALKGGQKNKEYEKSQETMLILDFLDIKSEEDKILFLQQHRDTLTEQFLSTAAESLGFMEAKASLGQRCDDLIRYLKIKTKHESGRFR